MREELHEELFRMEQEHWWFVGRRRVVMDLLRRYLPEGKGGGRQRIADLGCGCGGTLVELSRQYEATGMDGSAKAIEYCRQRGVRATVGKLPGELGLEAGAFEGVLMLDVLEHLEEDAAAVKAAAGLLGSGGILLCTVPAYWWLWSPRDEHHGHRRRYSRGQFARLFEVGGLRVELLSYYNTWLFPLAVGERLARRWWGDKDRVQDLRVPRWPINGMLRGILGSERKLLGRVGLPFGLSLAGVARKV